MASTDKGGWRTKLRHISDDELLGVVGGASAAPARPRPTQPSATEHLDDAAAAAVAPENATPAHQEAPQNTAVATLARDSQSTTATGTATQPATATPSRASPAITDDPPTYTFEDDPATPEQAQAQYLAAMHPAQPQSAAPAATPAPTSDASPQYVFEDDPATPAQAQAQYEAAMHPAPPAPSPLAGHDAATWQPTPDQREGAYAPHVIPDPVPAPAAQDTHGATADPGHAGTSAGSNGGGIPVVTSPLDTHRTATSTTSLGGVSFTTTGTLDANTGMDVHLDDDGLQARAVAQASATDKDYLSHQLAADATVQVGVMDSAIASALGSVVANATGVALGGNVTLLNATTAQGAITGTFGNEGSYNTAATATLVEEAVAKGNIHLDADGVGVEGDAIAGSYATAGISGSVGYHGNEIDGGAAVLSPGAFGLDLGGTVSYHDGKITLGSDTVVSLLFGGVKLDFQITLNTKDLEVPADQLVNGLESSFGDAANHIAAWGGAFSKVGEAFQDTATAAADAFSQGAGAVENGLVHAGWAVEAGIDETGHVVADAFKDAGYATSSAVESVADHLTSAVVNATHEAQHAMNVAADAAAAEAAAIGNTIEHGVVTVADDVAHGVEQAADEFAHAARDAWHKFTSLF